MEDANDDRDRSELFIKLLAENERRLTAYVMTFVPRAADADDILQEMKLGLWRSFDRFEVGTNFGAWARQAAFNRIMDFRRRKGRESKRLVFSDSCVESIADAFERDVDLIEAKSERLSDCVARLRPDHARIISLRYSETLSVEEIAERVGRSAGATYRVLSRIRLALRDCVLGFNDETQPHGETI